MLKQHDHAKAVMPDYDMVSNMFPIDIVIPWVDDTDENWKKQRNLYLGKKNENIGNLNHYFRDWETLKYVFRSIDKNMNWVRYVHFITCGHLPSWLNLNSPKLKFHKHQDFFTPESVLPTFSCRPIEMNLMNIPDLAEHFVYFNDDTVVMKGLTPDRFFKNDLPIDYLVLDIPRGGWIYDKIRIKDAYAQTVKNSINAINRIYPIKKLYRSHKNLFFDKSYLLVDRIRNLILPLLGIYKWIKVHHNPQPFLLSNLQECVRLFAEQINETRKHRFRENTDFNQYLFRDISLMSGRFHPHYFNDDFCMVLSSIKSYQEQRHLLDEKNFICLNDTAFLAEDEYPILKKLVIEDMNRYFPEKSSFEM